MSRETILVVDDVADILRLVRGFLEERGYVALTASDGAEALRLAGGYTGPIHVLLTDVVMPGLTGPELAGEMQRQRHETKIVYMSGFTREVTDQYGLVHTGALSIGKPFTADTLVAKLRQALDHHSPFTRPPAPAPSRPSGSRSAPTVFKAPHPLRTHEA